MVWERRGRLWDVYYAAKKLEGTGWSFGGWKPTDINGGGWKGALCFFFEPSTMMAMSCVPKIRYKNHCWNWVLLRHKGSIFTIRRCAVRVFSRVIVCQSFCCSFHHCYRWGYPPVGVFMSRVWKLMFDKECAATLVQTILYQSPWGRRRSTL